MGDQALISYQLVKKIYPARKFIIIASVIFIVLSLLIVLESAFMFTSTTKVGNPVLVIFSYLLAWFLIMVGLMGLKIACLANTLNTTVRSVSNTSGRPSSAPAWISTPEMAPDIIPDFDLPGAVSNEFCLYPPPPPRYSSLGDVPPVPSTQAQTENAPTTTMYQSYNATSTVNQPTAVQRTAATTNILSPPPPY